MATAGVALLSSLLTLASESQDSFALPSLDSNPVDPRTSLITMRKTESELNPVPLNLNSLTSKDSSTPVPLCDLQT